MPFTASLLRRVSSVLIKDGANVLDVRAVLRDSWRRCFFSVGADNGLKGDEVLD